MIAFAWILMLAASARVDLVDEVYQIPANKWHFVEVTLQQKPAMVHAHYIVESAPAQVRLALMRREDLDRLFNDLPHGVIEETALGTAGGFSAYAREPGKYGVVVDNQSDVAATVRVRVWLDFGSYPGHDVTRLSPQRQFVVILLSFATFFGIVTWSARRLLREIKK